MVAEVARELHGAARDREARIRDAVRIGDERIARVGADIARGPRVRRRPTQNVDAGEGEFRDGAADLRREFDARLAERQGQPGMNHAYVTTAGPKGILPLMDALIIYVI